MKQLYTENNTGKYFCGNNKPNFYLLNNSHLSNLVCHAERIRVRGDHGFMKGNTQVADFN